MEKEQIHYAIPAFILYWILVAYVSKALAKFKQKQFDFLYKTVFQLQFKYRFCYAKESKIVCTLDNFIDVCGNRDRQS